MSQLPFNFAAGEAARDAALEQVEGAADREWKDEALEAVYKTALQMPSFIVDEVWGRLADGVDTHDLRAMGPVMKKAQSMGYIIPTERYQLTARASSHRSPRRIWESNILIGGATNGHPHHDSIEPGSRP